MAESKKARVPAIKPRHTPPATPKEPTQARRNALRVDLRFVGDTPEDATAWALTRPQVQAAATIQQFQGDNLEVNALVRELSDQVAAVNRGDLRRTEAMLIAQAHTLDELFNNLARRAHGNIDRGYRDAGETYLRLALKAQGQCRATLETLAVIKNPPVFARQANINNGGQQQVNNGAAPEPSASARESQIPETKILEHHHGQRLDTGATGATGGADPHLAAVGKGNGAEDRRRKGQGRA